MELHWGKPFPAELLPQLETLDLNVYGAEACEDGGNSYARYLVCPDYFSWCTEGDRLVAVWCTYPIRTELWDRILASERVLDSEVGPDWILQPGPERPVDLMVFDLQVHPDYRGMGLTRRMMEGYLQLLRLRRAEGCLFRSIMGYVVTRGGRDFISHYGARFFQPQTGGTPFYVALSQLLGPEFETESAGERSESPCVN